MFMNESTKFNVPTLADKAVLVRLKRSMYQPYAFDRETTTKVELDTGVRKAGRFNKRLFLDCYELKDTNSAFNDVYSYHMLHTVPWLDDGVRMLPSAQYFDYTQAMRELMQTAKRKADNLAIKWPTLVAQDIARLGPLARYDDYPVNVSGHYDVGLKFRPVPQTSDFRVAISDEDKDSLNSAIAEAEAGVAKYLLAEMLDPIKKAVEKLAVPIGQEGSFFRDSLLGNITGVVSRARKLNITNDPTVTALVDEINAAISGYAKAPDLLREDIGARALAQSRLNGIMNKMSGLF